MKVFSHLLIFWLAALVSSESPLGFYSEDPKAEVLENAPCEFTLDLLKTLNRNSNSSNIVFSPASISLLLAVIQQGAEGNTADQLAKVLHLSAFESFAKYKNFSSLGTLSNITISSGSKCYVTPTIELNTAFQEFIEKNFGVKVEKLNFASKDSASRINKWVQEVTQNEIKDAISQSQLSPDTIMLLINAIFFKGLWSSPFKKNRIREGKFEKSPEQSVQASFMAQKNLFHGAVDGDLNAKWVELPFQNSRFCMFLILPTRRHKLDELLEKLTGKDLQRMVTGGIRSSVKVRIPKFKLSEQMSLVETMKKLGLEDIFSPASGLSGIVKEPENFQVSDIVHKANIEVDEKGSRASAVSYMLLYRTMISKFSFIADQPFLFFIFDKENVMPLFAGKVVHPHT